MVRHYPRVKKVTEKLNKYLEHQITTAKTNLKSPQTRSLYGTRHLSLYISEGNLHKKAFQSNTQCCVHNASNCEIEVSQIPLKAPLLCIAATAY